MARKNLIHPKLLSGNHRRMNDGVQLLQTAVFEGQIGQPRALQAAIGAKNFRAKGAHNPRENRLPRLHQRASQFVGHNDLRAQRGQHGRDCAFAAAQTASESNSKHLIGPIHWQFCSGDDCDARIG